MDDGSPSLEVGFVIDPGGSFDHLAQLQRAMGSTEAQVVSDAKAIERATGGMVNVGGGTAAVRTFGSAATRELENVRMATQRAEKSGEGMVRQLQRQVETYGKTASEIRNMRAEQRALAAEGQGLTELAGRIRALNASMNKLESGTRGATKGSSQMRAAMQGASYQVQDLITQISMGANPINALAVQGGQLAGQFSNVENKAGAVARFMIGPWGLAITAGTMILAPFVAKLLQSNDALDDAVDKLRKDATETRNAERAKEIFANTLEGVRAALIRNRKALDELADAGKTAARRALEEAIVEKDRHAGIVRTTEALITQLEVQIELNRERNRIAAQDPRLAGALNAETATTVARIAKLRKEIAGAAGEAAEWDRQITEALSRRLVERSEARATALGRIKEQYEGPHGLIEMARQQASADEVRNGTLSKQIQLLREAQHVEEEKARAAERRSNADTSGVSTFRSREQAIGMAGKELQGAGFRVDGNVQFGFTGGHANNADHNRFAVDVNAGLGVVEANIPDLKKRFDELARLYQARGFDVIWNKQFYAAGGSGPSGGAAGHTNHLHIKAPETIVGKATQSSTARQQLSEQAKVLADQKREYDAAVQAADSYIAAQIKAGAESGKSAKEIRLMQDAIQRLAAPTEAQKKALDEAAAAREAAFGKQAAIDFEANIMRPLRDEIALYGLVGPARAQAALELEKEGFLAQNMGEGIEVATARWNEYYAAKKQLIDQDAILEREASAIRLLNEEWDAAARAAENAADAIASAFGKAGNSVADALDALISFQSAQQEIAEWKEEQARNGVAQAEIERIAQLKSKNAQIEAAGSLLRASKSLFKEHSTGYQAMEAAERAFAIVQAVNTVRNVAAGAAKMFATLGPFAFPAVAAMIAVMASFGFRGGSSSGSAPTSAADLQAAQGAGSVLGDPTAKSESIAHALDIMSKNSTKGIDQSADMVRSLKNIESGIGNLAAAVARSLQLSGGPFDASGLGTSTKNGFGFAGGALGGLLGGLLGGKTTITKSLFDQGLEFDPTTLANAIANGISGSTYQIIEKIKKSSGFLGIGGGTKTSYSTTTSGLDPELERQVGLILGNLRDSVVDAAKILGMDVAAALNAFTVEIGQISFKDMGADEITSTLEAVFSKIGDQMAGFAVAGLAQFQMAGEGLFETLNRLAKDYLTIDAALKSIGMTFGAVGAGSIAARESLIELTGGLDAFTDQVGYFYDHFLSDAQKLAFMQSQVNTAFQGLGVAVPASIDQFASLVTGLNLSTDAGQQMFAALMQIAPAFYEVATAADQLAKKQQELQVQLLQAQGRTAEATALQRQVQLAELAPELQALQQQVWAAQDAAAAAAEAQQRQNDRTRLQIQLLEAQGKAEAALALQRKADLAAMDPALRALQKQVWQAQDIAAAKDKLVAAYERESAAIGETATKFHKFADDLRAFRHGLFTTGHDGLSRNAALIELMKQAGLARGGDEKALGGGLQQSAQQFLDVATENARTLQDVQRARALVAGYVDQGIAGAESHASLVEQQLDQMKSQVGALVNINDSVLTVHDAIVELQRLMGGSSPGTTPSPAGNSPRATGRGKDRDGREPDWRVLDRIAAATEQAAVSSNRTARVLDRADRGGSLAIATDADTPLNVVTP